MRYAFRNILRFKARSVLSLLVCLAIFFLAMLGYLIRTVCEDARYRFYGPLDGSVHVTDETLQPFLTYDAACAIVEASGDTVKHVSAVKEYVAWLPELEYVGYGTYRRNRYSGEELTEDRKANYLKGFGLFAVTSMEILEEVYRGDLSITEGTMITDEDTAHRSNKIVISRELAEQNGLSLGDTVTLDMLSIFQSELQAVRLSFTEGLYDGYTFDYTYVIGGIYENSVDNAAAVSEPWKRSGNIVYVPITTVEDIGASDTVQLFFLEEPHYPITENPTVIPDSLYLHLSDLHDATQLEEAINGIGFVRNVRLTEYVSDTSSSPSARFSAILSALLVGIVGVGFVVLVLSVLFHMRSRRRELAMLAALGQGRKMIATGFFLEYAVLMLIALIASGGLLVYAVSLLTVPLMRYLYSVELSAQFQTESADFFILKEPMTETVYPEIYDSRYLLTEYIVPSVGFAILAAFFLMILIYILAYRDTVRIHPLYDVGGKEQEGLS
ncbi:MAG: ABC transporter permease [Clostridia bacterium]|nr:ABC transporter permease [Clostridia bacterium]